MYFKHFYAHVSVASIRRKIVVASFLVACMLVCQQVVAQNIAQVLNLSATLQVFDMYVNGVKTMDDFAPFGNAQLVELSSSTTTEIVIAPSSSQSAQEGWAFADITLLANQQYILAIFDQEILGQMQPQLATIQKDNLFSGDPATAEVAFSHLIPSGPALNILLRSGGMIVGDLPFGQTAYNIQLANGDNYLDVKAQGTANILGTYRLSLQGYESKVTHVFMVGSTENANTLKLYALVPDGYLFPVDAAPIGRVQFINALAETIDIYKNNTRFADNAAYGTAMEFKNIPAGISMKIDICDDASTNSNNPWGTKNYTFQNMVGYTAIAAGSMTSPSMFLHHNSREEAIDTNAVEFLFFNGLPDQPLVSVWNSADVLVFENIGFGTFSSYLACAGNEEIFTVRSGMTGDLLGHFQMTGLNALKGQAITVVMAPNPTSQAAECWAARADGMTTPLVSVPSNVDENFLDSGVTIAPNPTSEATLNIFVKNENLFSQSCTYYIIGVDGRVAQRGLLDLAERSTIPISGLRPGLYILNLIPSISSTYNLKFLKW